jgi:tetratricopeptide (TPR) repeat protein
LFRAAFLLGLISLRAVSAQPPPSAAERPYGQLDASPTLFYVMAAVNAAGFDQEADSPTNHPLRKTVRDYLVKQNLSSLPPLRRYLSLHLSKNGGNDYSQFVSFALASKGAPDFTPAYPNLPQPPDADALFELPPLLAAFYKEADLERLWNQVHPELEKAVAEYSEPVILAVQQANAYLRDVSGVPGRHFQIFIDVLGPPNQVQTRSYVYDDFVVVTPAADQPIDEIRHAYLRFLTDPLRSKYAADIQKKDALHGYALDSPILAQRYRDDFVQLAMECFIKAVESRLDRRPAEAQEALREGFILTPAFAEALMKYEKQETVMKLYFPDLVADIDLKKERQRLASVDFLKERPVRTYRVLVPEKPPELTGVAKLLDQAEQFIADRAKDPANVGRAKDLFMRVLEQTDEKPMHAKAYYGLARVAVLENDGETGDRLFRKVLESDPDPATQGKSLVYLGKLADTQGQTEEAQGFYKAALAIRQLPDGARQDAENGLQGAYARHRSN